MNLATLGFGDITRFNTVMYELGSLLGQAILVYWVGELLMAFRDVIFLPSRASFSTMFLEILVEVKASKLPHVL